MQEMHATSIGISMVALLAGLVVLGLLIAGVVLLFVKLRAKAWWIVGPVLGLGLLVVVPLVLGLHFLDVPYAMPDRHVNTYPATPERPHAVSVSDVADGNSARGIASDQSYYNEDGSAQPRASDQSYYREDGSAYADPSGADRDLDLSPRSARGGGEPVRVWALGGGVLVILLVAGVVLLFVKLRAKAWWIVGPVLGLGLLVLPAGLLVTTRSSQKARMEDEVRSRAYQVTYSRTTGGTGRSDSVKVVRSGDGMPARAGTSDATSAERISETFLADVYPSALQAAEALAAHVARSFHSSPDQSATPTPPAEPPSPVGSAEAAALPDVKVVGNADATILQAVADALRKGALARRVEIAPGGAATPQASRPAPAANEIICAVRVDGGESGTVQIVLESPDRQITRAARFVSKPWAANFAQYVAGAGKPVVRAESGAVASFEEAQERAFDDAVGKLVPYVSSVLNRTDTSGGVRQKAVDHGAILAELRKGKMVIDRFSQQFDRPYGKLWREQILIDASPKAIEPIAAAIDKKMTEAINTAAAARRADLQTWWTLTVSLGGLAVLIFAVYLVLNAATKGYYTWVLRLLAIGAIIAGLALACIA